MILQPITFPMIVNDMVFRQKTEMDDPFFQRLFGTASPVVELMAHWPRADPESYVSLQYQCQCRYFAKHYPHADHRIIEWEREPVGRLSLDYGETDWWLLDLSLLPPFRGFGIGTTIMHEMIAQAEKAQCTIRFRARRFDRAQSFFERLGFQVHDECGAMVTMAFPVVQKTVIL